MNLDDAIAAQPVNITCTRCGHDFTKLLGKIEREDDVTCPSCGDVAKVDQALKDRIAAFKQQIAQRIDDQRKSLDRFLQDLNRRSKR